MTKTDFQKSEQAPYRHSDPAVDEALDWYLRLGDDHSADTLQAFEAWCSGNAAGAAAFDELARLSSMPALRSATLADSARLSAPAKATMPSRRFRIIRFAAATAMAACLLLVAVGQLPTARIWLEADHRTATGEQQTVMLPDGSSALLNTGSAIAVDFSGDRRQVTLLRGEAFFDVRHDADQPFTVHGHFADVTVKGTAFGVRSDANDDVVILERGSVEVRPSGDPDRAETLSPGEMIVADRKGLAPIRKTDTTRALAWREGRVIFQDRRFDEALADLDRYYRGSAILLGKDAAAKTISGNYRTNYPEAAIRTLAVSAGLSVTELPGGILILR